MLLTAAPVLAASLWLDAGSIAIFEVPVELPIQDAVIEIKPESLEKKSVGPPVTAFIEAPSGTFDVAQIDLASIRLCLDGRLCDPGIVGDGKPKLGDADGDGIADLKVTFDRMQVLAVVDAVEAPATVLLAVSGVVYDGTAFSGAASVKLVDPEPIGSPGPLPSASSPPPASPSEAPTAEPMTEPPLTPAPPSDQPAEPTGDPVTEPTPEPTSEPTSEPTPDPSADPSESAAG